MPENKVYIVTYCEGKQVHQRTYKRYANALKKYKKYRRAMIRWSI